MRVKFIVCRPFGDMRPHHVDDPMHHLRVVTLDSRERALETLEEFRRGEPNHEWKVFMMVSDQIA